MPFESFVIDILIGLALLLIRNLCQSWRNFKVQSYKFGQRPRGRGVGIVIAKPVLQLINQDQPKNSIKISLIFRSTN